MVDWEHRDLSIVLQADLLSINRTSLYYKPIEPSLEEIVIKHKIDEIYTKWPFYGSRRIAEIMKRDKVDPIIINRKAVQRHMREMGISAIYPGPNLSKRRLKDQVYPYLLRGMKITQPNQVWGTDITYIRLKQGWLYLVAIIDWYSRYIISWQIDQTLEIGFVIAALNRALAVAIPGIMNSDQGSHFTSPQYTDLLKAAGVNISMDGRGRALDNIFTERFWRNLKYEEVYLKDYQTPREARHGIHSYFDLYNFERPHQSLGYRTPGEVYFDGSCS